MFNTEHLSGRCVYETDKVVCIDVYLSPKYSLNTNIFLTQMLLSLVNQKFAFGSVSFSNILCVLSNDEFEKEIKEGVRQYTKTREALGLLQ